MNEFEHLRHKDGFVLNRPREIIVACAPMRSNVNISTVARTASACAVERLVLTGNAGLISKIARDGAEELEVGFAQRQHHAALLPLAIRRPGRPAQLGPAALEPLQRPGVVVRAHLVGFAVANAKLVDVR